MKALLACLLLAAAYAAFDCDTSAIPGGGYVVLGQPYGVCTVGNPGGGDLLFYIYSNVSTNTSSFAVSVAVTDGNFAALGVAGYPGGAGSYMPDGHAVVGKCGTNAFNPPLLVHLHSDRYPEAETQTSYVLSRFIDCSVPGSLTFGFTRTTAGTGTGVAGDVRPISTTDFTQAIMSSGACGACTALSSDPNPSSNPNYHQTNRVSLQINYAAGGSQAAPVDENRKIHGGLMGVGWGMILPFGAIIARYTKPSGPFPIWPNVDDSKHWQIWFTIHWILQHTGLLLVTIGIGYAKQIGSNTYKAHRALGSLIMALGYIQFITGWTRPHKEKGQPLSTFRIIFEYVHKNFGRFAVVMSIAQVQMGMDILAIDDFDQSYRDAYSAGVGIMGGICLIGELVRLLFPPKAGAAAPATTGTPRT